MRALACVLGCFGVVLAGAVVGYTLLYKDYVATLAAMDDAMYGGESDDV